MTVWAYYRVSTAEQNYESQKVGVTDYANRNGIKVDKEVIDDGVSGTIQAKDRNFWKIVTKAVKGDLVITSELSRVGRSASDVLTTLKKLSDKGVDVYFVKQAMRLDNSPMGKMMTAILSAFAEMERDLISQRTKEGLQRAKMNGVHVGRPNTEGFRKLQGSIDYVKELIDKRLNKTQIAKELNCDWNTINRFMRENDLRILKAEKPIMRENTVKKEAIEKGFKVDTIYNRLSKGYTVYDCFFPLQKAGRPYKYYYQGKPIREYCKEIGLRYKTVIARIERGWTIRQALGK